MKNKLKNKHFCIFSFTPVSDEPRVLRQAKALYEKGAKVTIVGYPGKAPIPEFWNFIDVNIDHKILKKINFIENGPEKNPELARKNKALVFLKKFKKLTKILKVIFEKVFKVIYAIKYRFQIFIQKLQRAGKILPICLFPGIFLPFKKFFSKKALNYYWDIVAYKDIFEKLPDIKADFYIAHDYFTLPIVHEFVKKHGGFLSIDCHEHATTQYYHSLGFRLFQAPWIHTLQKFLFPKVDCLTVVCDGIGDLLKREYHLKRPPVIIRSIPYYQKCLFKPTDPHAIKVLYHGCIAQKRGLEELIQSIPLWAEQFSLIIRGPGDKKYVEQLKEKIVALKIENRVMIEDPIPSFDLIKRANQDADIGYFAQPQFSVQKKYTLPNKFFEYIMAGTCIVINEAQEMKKICDEYDLGNFIKNLTPQGIANTINSLTAEKIDEQKKKSLLAAQTLCFEAESEKMLNLYNDVF